MPRFATKHPVVYAKPEDTSENRELLASLITQARTQQAAFEQFVLAVFAIKQRNLWMLTHTTWDDFCEQELGASKRFINQQLDSGRALFDLKQDKQMLKWVAGGIHGSHQQPILTTERQLRALVKIPHADRGRVLEHAAQTGRLTAEVIRESAKQLTESGQQAKQAAAQDFRGEIPQIVRDAVAAGEQYEKAAVHIRSAAVILASLIARDTCWGIEADWPDKLRNFATTISNCRPCSECVGCHGKGCKGCQKTGWLTAGDFSRLDEEVREMSLLAGNKA